VSESFLALVAGAQRVDVLLDLMRLERIRVDDVVSAFWLVLKASYLFVVGGFLGICEALCRNGFDLMEP
jgi:hypothetical protein